MSGPKTGGKAGNNNGALSIPAADRKLVSSLKEVVPHTEEEIYAMFKECNRDPDETVQRLLSEEKFHLVKRKRDKKKMSVKDASEVQMDSGISFNNSRKNSGNAGTRGSGTGVSLAKGYLPSGGTKCIGSKVSLSKEVGIISDANICSTLAENGSLSYSHRVQPKNTAISNFETLLPYGSSCGDLQAVPSQIISSGSMSTPTLQGAWLGTGHGTIADMLKSKTLTGPSSTGSEYYSVPNTCGALSSSVFPSLFTENSVSVKQGLDTGESGNFNGQINLSFVDGSVIAFPENSSSMTLSDEQILNFKGQLTNAGNADVPAPVLGNHSTTNLYQKEQIPVVERGATVVENGIEVAEEVHYNDASSVVNEASSSVEMLCVVSTKLQGLSVRETQSVIIPDHIRVSEADYTTLSFGSFGSGFGRLQSDFTEEQKSVSFEHVEDTSGNNSAVAGGSTVSSPSKMNPTILIEEERHQKLKPVEGPAPFDNEVDIKKNEPFEQAQSQHVYSSGYPSATSGSSGHTDQHPHVATEAWPQDINIMMQQSYNTSTYYSEMFRTSADIDARYSAFLPSTTSKLGGRCRPAGTVENVSQEVVNTAVFSKSGSKSVGAETMQAMNTTLTSMTQSQQSLPTYVTQQLGLTMGLSSNVYSNQCVPPGFSYLQSPYQQNFVSTSNYQVPSSVGTAMKYPFPQYKVGAMHSTIDPGSTGYGSYTGTQHANYAVNPLGSTGKVPAFDEGASQQSKETNAYLSSQQMEGPSVWLQSQLARDLHNSSYYNLLGQNQQTRYSPSRSLLPHTHPSYHGDLYNSLHHHHQYGSSPITNQLLQHSSIGSVGALAAQIGSYQQAQKSQQTWTNGF